jgi:hypothetical protein
MNEVVRLVTAAALGALVATSVAGLAAPAPRACSGSADMTRIDKRFDYLEQAIVGLQSQSAKAASDDALADSNIQRQLDGVSSQVAGLNSSLVALSGRIR